MSSARGALAPFDIAGMLASAQEGRPKGLLDAMPEPGLRGLLGQMIYDAANSAGLGSNANRMRNEASAIMDLIPGVGEAVGADDARRSFNAGNYGQAALDAGTTLLGAIPGGGDLAAGAAKAVMMSLPMYHGSRAADLTELLRSDRGALGPGVYATPAPNIAERYGDNVYELEDVPRDIHQGLGSRYGSGWDADNERLLRAVEPEKRAELEAIIGKMWSGDGYPMRSRIAQMYRDESKAEDLYRRAGFEGIAGHADGPEVVLFEKQKVRPR